MIGAPTIPTQREWTIVVVGKFPMIPGWCKACCPASESWWSPVYGWQSARIEIVPVLMQRIAKQFMGITIVHVSLDESRIVTAYKRASARARYAEQRQCNSGLYNKSKSSVNALSVGKSQHHIVVAVVPAYVVARPASVVNLQCAKQFQPMFWVAAAIHTRMLDPLW